MLNAGIPMPGMVPDRISGIRIVLSFVFLPSADQERDIISGIRIPYSYPYLSPYQVLIRNGTLFLAFVFVSLPSAAQDDYHHHILSPLVPVTELKS